MARRKKNHTPSDAQALNDACDSEVIYAVLHEDNTQEADSLTEDIHKDDPVVAAPVVIEGMRLITRENAKSFIARTPFKAYKIPSLQSQHVAKTMPAGVEIKIMAIKKSAIHGQFYKLPNGLYAPMIGDYLLKG